MSQIKTKDDIDITIDYFISTAIINRDQANELKTVVENIINHPLLSYLFSPDLIIYNEKDIITKHGKILRPDRVVINSLNEATVVDYKTGVPNNNHTKQIETYSNALRVMSHKVNKGVIIYTNDSIEIKEV